MKRESYAPHAVLTLPTFHRCELWRLVLGLVLATVIMFGLTRGIIALISGIVGPDRFPAVLSMITSGRDPWGLLAQLSLMGAMGIGAIVVAETLHGRTAGSLFGPARLFWPQFLRVAAVLVALNVVIALLPPWPLQMASEPGLPPGQWLALLPLTIGALLVQTASEEVLFRGYFQSTLAARVKWPAVWLILPSLAFGLGHYAPDVWGSNAVPIALWAVAFGLAAADLTARSGSLGPAIAFHLVNNFVAIGVMSLQGDLSGLALTKLPYGPEDEAALAAILPVDLATLFVSWLAARLALRV
ncbi:CPBP family intramembrane metalloprotease [Sagittula sp. P11]|uniref:CPBP family intramembrane glutamic endopeptidase n=1 Tax=unclassified Sagittula TaxID=2624628 RepID=UPI000C2D3815|nr:MULTISPECIES: CPBP family intramembrane glutamic endopeptidase [unclassified Sagittula]AUC53399.1 CPBP family intramembrane metalloprotease [Sagittula sp. P11]WHZ35005.1 CPBP family intramembrane metalloprotease [Sagittula sp. MA-2]